MIKKIKHWYFTSGNGFFLSVVLWACLIAPLGNFFQEPLKNYLPIIGALFGGVFSVLYFRASRRYKAKLQGSGFTKNE